MSESLDPQIRKLTNQSVLVTSSYCIFDLNMLFLSGSSLFFTQLLLAPLFPYFCFGLASKIIFKNVLRSKNRIFHILSYDETNQLRVDTSALGCILSLYIYIYIYIPHLRLLFFIFSSFSNWRDIEKLVDHFQLVCDYYFWLVNQIPFGSINLDNNIYSTDFFECVLCVCVCV